MKKLSKILALVLALVLVSSCLIGCSEKEIKKIVNSAADVVNKADKSVKSDSEKPSTDPVDPSSKPVPDPVDPATPPADETDEEEITSAIECYFFYATSLDFETALLWVDPESELYSQMEAVTESINPESIGLTEEEFSDITFELSMNSGCEITNLEIDGNTAVAEVEFYAPDTTQFDPTTDSVDDIKNLDVIENSGTITLEKIDGEWLIVKDE